MAQADSLQAKIAHLMEVSGAEQQFIFSAISMIEMQEEDAAFDVIPDAWWSKFKDKVRNEGWSNLLPSLVQIYRDNYSEEEIDYLIAYHTHPLSQRIAEKLPTVQRLSMEAGSAWGEKIAQELLEKLEETSEGN